MSIPFLDLGPLNHAIREELHAASRRVIDSGWYILGPELDAFETEFAAYCDSTYCAGVGNGLNAITLALQAVGVQPGDEVIVPSHTFVGTWLAISEMGATPVPVEVDNATYNLDPTKIEAAITPKTTAIVPVHLYGQAADMAPIVAIAKQHGLWVVSDCAQAQGAQYHGKNVAAWGDATAFSFYPTKNLGALGDAGAVVTNNADVAERVKKRRNYGSTVKYVNDIRGTNSRLDELQAAFLRVKLGHLDKLNANRTSHAQQYLDGLQGLPELTLPTVTEGCEPVWHLFVVRHPQRNELQRRLQNNYGIQTLLHYPIACHHQQCYQAEFANHHYPIAEAMADTVLSLPIDPMLSSDEIAQVINAVRTESLTLAGQHLVGVSSI